MTMPRIFKECDVTDLCLYDVIGGVAVITLNRPEQRNGMTGDMELAYFGSLLRADRDPAVRSIIVTGAGSTFCPGADFLNAAEEGAEPLPNTKVRLDLPLTIRKPTVAAINGACAGVGLVIALECDVRFAARGARFTTAFARRGLIAEYGIAALLTRVVGFGVASDLLISARIFEAEEARRIGLVNDVFERGDVLEASMKYAQDLAENVSPASMATIKRQLALLEFPDANAALAVSQPLMEESARGADFEEGVASFLESRQPRFFGLGHGTQFEWDTEEKR